MEINEMTNHDKLNSISNQKVQPDLHNNNKKQQIGKDSFKRGNVHAVSLQGNTANKSPTIVSELAALTNTILGLPPIKIQGTLYFFVQNNEQPLYHTTTIPHHHYTTPFVDPTMFVIADLYCVY